MTIGGEFVRGTRRERKRAGCEPTKGERSEQAACRAALLLEDWLQGSGDRYTIERAYRELERSLK